MPSHKGIVALPIAKTEKKTFMLWSKEFKGRLKKDTCSNLACVEIVLPIYASTQNNAKLWRKHKKLLPQATTKTCCSGYQ